MLSNSIGGHPRRDELMFLVQRYYSHELLVINGANQVMGQYMRSLTPGFIYQSNMISFHFYGGDCFLDNVLSLDSVHALGHHGLHELWAASFKCYVPPPNAEMHDGHSESWFADSGGTIDQDQMLDSYLLINELNHHQKEIYGKWLELNHEYKNELDIARETWNSIQRITTTKGE